MKGPCLDPACDCHAETERLKALLGCAADALTYETQKVKAQGHLERKEAQAEIARLKALLARAADALKYMEVNWPNEKKGDYDPLIRQLRKAAG